VVSVLTPAERMHTYTIVDAITDKNVLPFRIDYVNTIQVGVDVKDKKVPAIDTERALLDSRRIAEVVRYMLERFDQKTRRTSGYVYTLTLNVSDVAADRNRVEEVKVASRVKGFNALFATASMEAAKRYYTEFAKHQQALLPDHRLRMGLIYSYSCLCVPVMSV
jgi:type I restriction enzyme R subunit